MVDVELLTALADIVGWGYFLCWTVSFLPQIYENWKRKSVVGFSFDMLSYFFLSYVTYMIYNVTFYFNPVIRKEFLGGSDQASPVKMTDVVFSLVAFACTSFQSLQCLVYDRGSQQIHSTTIVACIVCISGLVVLVVLAFATVASWVLVLQYCGYVKMIVSFGTYLPQVLLNYKRKSTLGFHIGGVLLDFGGGVLSLLQMDLYCFIEHSNEQLTGNIPKMALAIVTLIFNVTLVWQHYVFYLGNEYVDANEKEPLLKGSRRRRIYLINADAESEDLQAAYLSPLFDRNKEKFMEKAQQKSQESSI